ncbi:aminotransferase class III-fold pyridoxal phosphate-dependent enzyme [Candidatus Woesearchaeota archaeon]|nr:aminotransferase class III-fold pyridoxal phosphate-dependent enzyme [Candidatus Woesearchaeota archaeon]
MTLSCIAPQFGHRDQPFTVIGGQGLFIETKEYGQLFDATAGYWYNILGMRHPELMSIKAELGGVVSHLYEDWTNPWAEDLALRLCKMTGKQQAIFAATGSMACENARKEAVAYHLSKGRGEHDLLFAAINGGYHGSVGLMLDIADPRKNKVIINGPVVYPNNASANNAFEEHKKYLSSFEDKIKEQEKKGKKVAAVFYEPVMGVRGAVELPKEYIRGIQAICSAYDILLIADEVTTGFGRTGVMFVSQQFEKDGIRPDIICLGKGLSAGHYPIAVTLVNEKIVESWKSLEGETEREFAYVHRRGNGIAGTPEGAAIGLQVINTLERDHLPELTKQLGGYALRRLQPLTKLPNVRAVRGKGLLIAIDVKDSLYAKHIKERLRKEKKINMIPEGRMLMFCPAFTITHNDIDRVALSLEDVLE